MPNNHYHHTIEGTIAALDRLAAYAQVVDCALQKHCRNTVGDHEKHGFLRRLHAVADFRLAHQNASASISAHGRLGIPDRRSGGPSGEAEEGSSPWS